MQIRSGDQAFLYLLFTLQCLAALYLFTRLLLELCRCAKRSTKKSFFIRLGVAGLLAYWAWLTCDYIQKDQSLAEDWDPYRVLKLEDDGQFNSKEVRDAYKRLSKKWHPDKVNWDKLKGQEENVQKRWQNLVLAYETLSKDRTKYDNWRQYGHPEGQFSIKVVELMLPTFLLEPQMRPMLLTSFFLLVVAIILYTTLKLKSSSFNLANGVSINSKMAMRDFLNAIYEDND